ncbi:MAG: hypothetical protein AAGI15_09155 [Pseudomonadota bacterium]
MLTPTLLALAIATVANAVGDAFMMYGLRKTNGRPGAQAIQQTPDGYLRWGGLSGLVTVSAWFLLVPMMTSINGWQGTGLLLSYCFYVAVTLSFHVSYVFMALGVKAQPTLIEPLGRLFAWLRLASFVGLVLVTVFWSADLLLTQRSLAYLLTTPLVTVMVLQLLGARFLRPYPVLMVASGPLAMLVFFAGFLHYVGASNTA